jgi:L-threonylcarbamoyladenylate synthase
MSVRATMPDQTTIEHAAQHLAEGHLVAFPTETVYGLGARADDDTAVAAIFAAKGRPSEHPLIVHLADAGAATAFATHISVDAQRLMDAFWPGPLTLILPRRADRGAAAAGGQASIGLRVPAHPVALAWLRACAQRGVAGVAGPSANRFGRVSPTTAAHVAQEFGAGLWVLDGGPCAVGIESTIVDCTRSPPALLRPGQLQAAALEAVLGVRLAAPDAASPRASGTLASHYAPAVPVRLWRAGDLLQALQAAPAQQARGDVAAKVVAVYSRIKEQDLSPAVRAHPGWLFRAMPDDADGAAQDLFSALRELEGAGVSAIWVEQPPASAAWDGVRDRLVRAAA